ncbi:hypothetical protein IMW75_24710 [Pseudomonas gregormendelii]|uniref:RING-type E3 ubiquitin transferase n=1 Tax=Pseudomonas gregormendelii TaxID=1628277 RepID=A0ABS3AND8_9PSED|nr:NEL-type E3 ubiquitin ligase domain-containing protein [Pseudomonas gregormendelii]MBN3968460.1 hypothetical protein [Pseudomonas gregormendelii]
MGINIQPPSSISNADTVTAVPEDSGWADSNASSELRGSRQSEHGPASLFQGRGQISPPSGHYQERLEQICAWQPQAAQATNAPAQANLLREWITYLCPQVLQYGVSHALNRLEPLTPLVRQMGEYRAGQMSAQAILRDWPSIWSKLSNPKTPSEFLAGVNQAIERGMAPLVLLFGLVSLGATPLQMIPLRLLAGAMLGYGQEQLIGWLRQSVGTPAREPTRIVQEVSRLISNCASLRHYAHSVNSLLAPSPGKQLRISWDKDTASAEVTAKWNQNKRLFAPDPASPRKVGQALVRVNNSQSSRSESPLTSAAGRLDGPLQAASKAIFGTLGWLCKNRPPAEHEADVEAPFLNDYGVYQPTTAPMAAAGQPSSALTTLMRFLSAAGVIGGTGYYAASKSMPDVPDLIPSASEPAALEAKATPSTLRAEQPPPHSRTLKGMLENEIHLTDDDKVISCWNALEAIHEAADPSVLPDLIKDILHEDFGPLLPRLVAADADSGKFEALDQPAPVRHRRAAETDPQAAEVALVEDIITLLDQASSAAQQQQDQDQQAFGRKLVSNLVDGHFLKNVSADELEMWLTTRQTLDASEKRLAALKYDSRQQFETNRPLLKQALAEVYEDKLRLAVVENKLKGHLSGDSDIPGLKVMTAALNGDTQVEVGCLELSIGEGADAIRLALPQLLVFTLRDANGAEAAVVLYRTENQLMEAFRSQQEMRQQEMFQFHDYRRMRQSLQAEVQPPATPGPAASRPASQAAPHPAPKPLPQLVVEAALPSERSRLIQFLVERGQRSDGWKPENLPVHNYPGDNLQEKFQHHAELELGREDAQLQRLAKNPELARLIDEAADSEKRKAAFTDEYLPTLYSHAWRIQTQLLTKVVREQGGLASNATVDPDDVLITFNNRTWSWMELILGRFREIADDPFAPSNNFIADALIQHKDPLVARVLNRPDVKEGIQQLMRTSYPGQEYVEYLKPWLDPNDPRGKKLAELNTDVTQKQLQATVEQRRVDGTMDSHTAGEFKILADGLPTVTDTGTASVQTLQISGRRIPGMLVVSKRQRATGQRTAEALRSDYVLFQGPRGWELMKLSLYLQLIRTPGAYSEDLLQRTKMSDKPIVDAFLRGQRDTGVATAPISNLAQLLGAQWLQDGIDNINEATTSRNEVMVEQLVKGLRGAATALCIVAAVPCAVVTAGLLVHDTSNVLHKLKDGTAEVMDSALMILDVVDVLTGVKVFTSGARAFTKSDIISGWLGHAPNNPTQMNEAAQTMVRQLRTDFTHSGRLNDGLARRDVTREQLTPLPRPPGKADAGIFYRHDGKHYIQDRYQDQVQVYEVYSDNAWATVRVRDPQQPNGHGAPVHYRDGHWRFDDGGLPGGGAASSNLGTEEKSHLLDEGTGPSGFRSEEASEKDLRLFWLDRHNPSHAEPIRATLFAIENDTPLPQLPNSLLENKSDGLRVYGVFGQKPFGPDTHKPMSIDALTRNFDPNTLKQIDADFHFSKNRAMYYLFLSGRQGTKWPDWGIKYARGETVLNHYASVDVLIHQKVFPNALVAKAFDDEFNVFPKEVRKRLLTDMINGGEVPLTVFPERVLVKARVQESIESGAFADAQAVSEYLAAFSLPNDILIMELLKARNRGGRTPAWAGPYLQLESWKRYESTLDLTPQARRLALQQVLVSEGVCIDLERADDYLKQFSASDELDTLRWELLEEVVMAALVEKGRRPVWAIESVKPESLMNIYRSEDIPKDMSRLEIVIKPGHLESSLHLPENMESLTSLTIVSRDTITTPIEVILPSYMRKLENLHLEGIILVETLSLDKMYELAKVVIVNCEHVKVLDFSYLLKLRSVTIVKNPQLHEFKVGRGTPRVQTLDVSSNPQLRKLALGYSGDELQKLWITDNPNLQSITFSAAMPELYELYLQGNKLRDLSFLANMRLPELVRVDLSHNQLSSLAPMPRAPMLEELQLEGNAFKEIPRFVTDLATPVKVNMNDNFISDSALRDFGSRIARQYPDQAVVQLIHRADEHSIQYARPLGEMVAICSVERAGGELRSLWGGFESEAYATEFSTFLGHLYQSKSFDDAVFGQQVSAWLERLATSTELRRETFSAADSACASCEDWVSSVYKSMQEIALRFNV